MAFEYVLGIIFGIGILLLLFKSGKFSLRHWYLQGEMPHTVEDIMKKLEEIDRKLDGIERRLK